MIPSRALDNIGLDSGWRVGHSRNGRQTVARAAARVTGAWGVVIEGDCILIGGRENGEASWTRYQLGDQARAMIGRIDRGERIPEGEIATLLAPATS